MSMTHCKPEWYNKDYSMLLLLNIFLGEICHIKYIIQRYRLIEHSVNSAARFPFKSFLSQSTYFSPTTPHEASRLRLIWRLSFPDSSIALVKVMYKYMKKRVKKEKLL